MDGYMIEADYVDDVLTVRGKNKAARIALAGAEHGAGDVVIARNEMASVDYSPSHGPLGFVNGHIIVRTNAGKKYQLTFRRKQQADFEQLARQLGAL